MKSFKQYIRCTEQKKKKKKKKKKRNTEKVYKNTMNSIQI